VRGDLWTRWRNDVFGDPYLVWHEGPDFTGLLELARSAPADVARMLAAGLATEDPLAAQSIAALADAGQVPEGAEALLRAAAVEATESFLVRVAQALHVVTGDESWAAPIASVLTSDAFWGVRIDAALVLAEFTPTTDLIEALGQGVRDDEYLVRYHSANTLLRYAGRTKPDVGNNKTLFNKITSDAEADLSKRQEAAQTLTEAALRALP
jgi:hypothetical protein